ncbi:2-amino-4-hydroxy-6-hydroxymethyldihydropteridine diphosphokinase [Desulfocurvibacter africanus]|uniref:2-amino-4-hydroxy-6- hydroxymethyldihydropteridine diphosphokinase n=1 Tax=Desulfocurvibacter africanus TaxID=873 RepID=UPI0009DB8794|nr:2-amino-4-hydroxy-6-hydroxymethyldihydropteridine diphosphokinase [Desulfocurvibacter africanus]
MGSNLGDARKNLHEAGMRIDSLEGVCITASSAIWQTEPQDLKDQPWFANQVLQLSCDSKWTPEGLLAALLEIEQCMGRSRGIRFGPRCIDLDLLLFGDRIMTSDDLILPHPRMRKRAFVLIPLREVAGNLIFPEGDTLDQALACLRFLTTDNRICQE